MCRIMCLRIVVMSLSSWRAWIEIGLVSGWDKDLSVALLMESVD